MKYLWVLLGMLFIGCSSTNNLYKVEHHDSLIEDQELNISESEWLRLGINEHDEGNYDAAIRYYKKVLVNKPNSSLALHEMALTQNATGNFDETLKYAKRGQQVDAEGRFMFYHMQGVALDYLGKPEEAVKAFEEGISINPNSHFLHYSHAITSLNLGRVNVAVESLQNSLKVNFGHTSSHLLLGRIYQDQGRNVSALMAYTYFLFYEPDSPRRLEAYEDIQAIFEVAEKGEEGEPVNITVNLFGSLGSGTGVAEIVLSAHSAKRFKEYEDVPTIEFLADGYESVISTLVEAEAGDNPSFEQEYYLPYLKQVQENEYTHAMVYMLFENSLLEGVTDWLNDNWDICEEFLAWEPEENEEI